jgi:D-3-phosphoglycerate dehydrogenase
MKPTALIVNTSRASLIQKGALEMALLAGRPGFAAIDVFEDEPVTGGNSSLMDMPNVICTPHLGYVEKENYESFFSAAAEAILSFEAGELSNVINPEALNRKSNHYVCD